MGVGVGTGVGVGLGLGVGLGVGVSAGVAVGTGTGVAVMSEFGTSSQPAPTRNAAAKRSAANRCMPRTSAPRHESKAAARREIPETP